MNWISFDSGTSIELRAATDIMRARNTKFGYVNTNRILSHLAESLDTLPRIRLNINSNFQCVRSYES